MAPPSNEFRSRSGQVEFNGSGRSRPPASKPNSTSLTPTKVRIPKNDELINAFAEYEDIEFENCDDIKQYADKLFATSHTLMKLHYNLKLSELHLILRFLRGLGPKYAPFSSAYLDGDTNPLLPLLPNFKTWWRTVEAAQLEERAQKIADERVAQIRAEMTKDAQPTTPPRDSNQTPQVPTHEGGSANRTTEPQLKCVYCHSSSHEMTHCRELQRVIRENRGAHRAQNKKNKKKRKREKTSEGDENDSASSDESILKIKKEL